MDPYRTPYIPPTTPKLPKKRPQYIIRAAEKAFDAFNDSCPEGLSIIKYMVVDRNYKSINKYASPHSTRYVIGRKYADEGMIPCCPDHRQALKDLNELNWFWRRVARFKLSRKEIFYRLIGSDLELMELIKPVVPKYQWDYIDNCKHRILLATKEKQ